MILSMKTDNILAERRRRFERILKEFHKKAGKKGKPTKEEEEEILGQIKEIRRELWKKYQKKLKRDEAERRTGVVRCAAAGCREPVDYVWVDAYLPDTRAILAKGEITCYPLCIKHDGMMHETIDKMRAEPSDLIRERIRIRR